MPGLDGTGPFGNGRPGRGLGPCGRFSTAPLRCGYGRGRGRGFGYRFRGGTDGVPYGYTNREPIYRYTKEDLQAEKAELERQLQWLNEQLSKEDNS